ncbi:MAG: phosphotransferase enzyme family protein [Fimbriimonadaceae bacterium]
MKQRDSEEDLKVVETYWPEIDESFLKLVGDKYSSLGAPVSINWHSQRPLSSAAIATFEGGEFFVKRHSKRVRTKEQLVYEHQFCEFLADCSVPAVTSIQSSEGETASLIQGWTVEVQPIAPGDDLYRGRHTWQKALQPNHLESIGAHLGDLHHASLQYKASDLRSVPFQSGEIPTISNPDLLSALQSRKLASKVLTEFLSEDDLETIAALYRSWHSQWIEVFNEIPKCVTHGDPCANNFMWQGDEVASIIDFHLCGLTTPALDLAIGIDRTCFHWLDILDGDPEAVSTDDARLLLQGYQDQRPLNEQEQAAAKALLGLHRLEFALSLMEYFLTFEQSKPKAEWCRDVYIHLHAEYLHSEVGARKVGAIFAS